jgi:transposase InsO family protein
MNIFARHGYPEEIVSDNGPQFISQEFRRFLRSKGIKHVRSSPYFPRSNGKIERFHRYLKNNFQAVTLEGRSWEEELPKILMSYRSSNIGTDRSGFLWRRSVEEE